MGRSNNSHKIFPRIFFDRTVCKKQGGMPSQEGGTEVTTPGVPGMSGTPNEFVLQPLYCCNTYPGELGYNSYAVVLF